VEGSTRPGHRGGGGGRLEDAGLLDEAVQAYAQAVTKEPRLTQSLFWQTTPRRLELRAAVIEGSGVDACDLGEAAVLYGAYDDDLSSILDGCRDHLASTASNSEEA
jgi:hypothetical protein